MKQILNGLRVAKFAVALTQCVLQHQNDLVNEMQCVNPMFLDYSEEHYSPPCTAGKQTEKHQSCVTGRDYMYGIHTNTHII